MSILSVNGLTHSYDGKVLFEKASFNVNAREHIGIVGFNGAGKSTFVNIIAKKVMQDDGEVLWQNGVRFGYLDQHADIDRKCSVMDYLKTSFVNLTDIENRLNQLYLDMGDMTDMDEMEKACERTAKMQEHLVDNGYYEMDATIKKIANGIGINSIGYDTVIGTLSGGQRAKVMLAKLLLDDYDMIMLDEPTNFLDLEHIEWLAKFLETYKGTFLLVSHDTSFLNRVTTFILSIENHEIKKYPGNYDSFLLAHENNQKQYAEAYERQQRDIKKMEDYIAKNKARAATAGMANSRKKMLEKIDVMSKPVTVLPSEFHFECNSLMTKDMVDVKNLEIGYSKSLLPPISLHLEGDDKLWVRGTNGIGKSTLVKTLMQIIPRLGGRFNININAKIGYLEQDFAFSNIYGSAIEYLTEVYARMSQKEIRSLLASVGLKGDLATKSISNLSGGEQVRAKIAALERKETNLLILDEPTNHLDVLAKAELLRALQAYPGAIILVSHEIDFANALCNKIFDAEKF
ncbi:MAG: ABC-F family ATP-binding cassette domain-containing protein [Clostridia bacterium]